MKTMLSSFVGHSMIDIGTQAIAGIGRSTSDTGKTNSRTSRKRPIMQAERHARRGREHEAEQDAPAAQHDVVTNFGSAACRDRSLSSTCSGEGTLMKRT